MVKLGDRVKDKITGLKGIATGLTEWLYGCRRVCVQPETAKDGKPAESFCVDDPQLEVLKEGVLTPSQPQEENQRRHGPRADPGRAKDPTR